MKRIGSFINPATGEEDWVEPETIPNILLIPNRVTRLGDTFETPVDFKMVYVEQEEVINLYAEYTVGSKIYRSSNHSFPVEDIANEIALIVYANKTLDDSTMMQEAKRITMQNLTEKLFNEGIILSNFNVRGLGYVYVQKQKAMLFESIQVQQSNRDITATISECYSSVSLGNLDSPKFVFNTGNHEIEFDLNSVTHAEEGRIKTYNLIISNLKVKQKTQLINLEKFADEERLLENRMQMLDSLVQLDDDFDDRFGDFFD